MPNWKSAESYQRLVAAMVAAQDMKLDYRKIATYYGEGTTYDSIEGRFRIIRKDAQLLRAEIDSGERPHAPARGSTTSSSFASTNSETTPKKPRAKKTATNGTPTPKKEKVLNGRVGKNATPTKPAKRGGFGMMDGSSENVINGLKEEPLSSGSSSHFGGDDDAIGDVIMNGGWEFAHLEAMQGYGEELVDSI